MQRKNLTLVFYNFEKEHLGKDVFLVPYYLGKKYNLNVTIVYPLSETNKDFPSSIEHITLIPVNKINVIRNSSWQIELALLKYVCKNASKIDILMRIHYNIQTAVIIHFYKKLNPKGKVYLKTDGYITPALTNPNSPIYKRNNLKTVLLSYFYKSSKKNIDIVSCETTPVYNKILLPYSLLFDNREKVKLMPNGFDIDFFRTLKIRKKSFAEKENIMITVGRLGSYPKNTQMLLSALENIDLKNWKVVLIGPIEDEFQKQIEVFFNHFPHKKDQVKFTGAVYDKKQLWEYYNKAKVFILTSLSEGFPLVFPEAMYFNNFIISTRLDASLDIINEYKNGLLIDQENSKQLTEGIENIISEKIAIDVSSRYKEEDITWEHMIQKLNFEQLI